MLRPCRSTERQSPRRSLIVWRQARPADRCVPRGRSKFCSVEQQRQRQACEHARRRLYRRQSAGCRIRSGGRCLRLHAVDQDHDRRPRHRHRDHRFRAADGAALDEVASKKLLRAYGIPVSKEEIAQTANDAVKIARKIGFPVVAKVVSAEILHKSDIGGVVLNLNSPAEVKKAFNDIIARVKKLKGKPKLEGILIAQQVKAELELVVGTALDAEMGPVVLFGTGGIDIELMKDVALAGAPLDVAEARQLISRTKAGVKLKGYRGKPALHEASAVKAIVGLSNLMADAGSRIASIDVNPFLINAKTGIAVDALIVLNNDAAKSAAGH